jgi:parallel beta-helix repeat protein
MKKTLLLALVTALASVCAFAVDGTVLINQSTVMAAGGFPYKITQPGSYRLSGNLVVPDANTTAISITVDHVNLDLNGFSISGPTVCTGFGESLSCAPQGSGAGVVSGNHNSISVFNGSIYGFGTGLFFGGFDNYVEKLRIDNNSSYGLVFGSGIIKDNVTSRNGAGGMLTGGPNLGGGQISGNVVSYNKAYGMAIQSCPAVITGNTVFGNGLGNLNINAIACTVFNNSAP